ncbi:MAG: VanZ family protein [Geopsychrobacter sp.]|nr:VanZ family protein [Geopsychrobacter sp.]
MLFRKALLPILLVVVLALFSLLPEKIVANIYSSVGRLLFSFDVWHKSYTQLVSNGGHLFGYMVLVLLFCAVWRIRSWQSGLIAMLVASIFEIAQLFIPSRQASFQDLGFDALGVGFALLIVLLMRTKNGSSRSDV